jgi:uncharacterized protein with NAD-binding domain and iron-sulfur cluster
MTMQELLTTLYDLFKIAIGSLFGPDWVNLWSQPDTLAPARVAPPQPVPLPHEFAVVAGSSPSLLTAETERARELVAQSRYSVLSFEHKLEAGMLWIKALEADPAARDANHIDKLLDLYDDLEASFDAMASAITPQNVPDHSSMGVKLKIMCELVNLFGAILRGFWRDLIIPDRPFEALDEYDFREWLLRHGAKPAVVNGSSITHALYDTMFQYIDGDVDRPSYAAGSALGVLVRMVCTFKGSVMWNIQAGMGEAVVAPLYDVLRANGVSFRFFRKVRKLEVAAGGKSVSRVHLSVQAKVQGGAEYKPTYLHPQFNLTCWPSHPDWDQLVDGKKIEAAGVNFESHWYAWPDAGTEVLEAGAEFDAIVLAIPVGAFKPLNAEPSMCADLINASRRFADFATKMELVPSQGVQLWSDRTPVELGWTTGKAALVSGPQYLNIWDDMSQVLDFEMSPCFETRPKTLYYMTGTLKTQLHKQPSTAVGTPQAAAQALRATTIDWLEHSSYSVWPNACDGKSFRYDVLCAPPNTIGDKRLDVQWLRANIDPTECCVASVAGTTQYRLLADESGFANLFVAGEATRHGFNTTTIEGAVMSGMAASRAICGAPATIVGYDFLRTKPSEPIK